MAMVVVQERNGHARLVAERRELSSVGTVACVQYRMLSVRWLFSSAMFCCVLSRHMR